MLDCPVDKFLLQSLQQGNPVLSHFITQSEASIRAFCSNEAQYELAFPPLNSFHRRCLHCLGRLYGLHRAVEETNLFNAESTIRSMSLSKPENYSLKTIPLLKCSDLIESVTEPTRFTVEAIVEEKFVKLVEIEMEANSKGNIDDNSGSNSGSNNARSDANSISNDRITPTTKTNDNNTTTTTNTTNTITTITDTASAVNQVPASTTAAPKIKILKRATAANDAIPPTPITTSSPTPATSTSIQEREVLYQAARERIFKDFPNTEPNATTPAFSALNPNAQAFTLPTTDSQPQGEPLSFPHIFTFSAPKALDRVEMDAFCQEAKASARLFEFPVREGFLIGKVIESEVLTKWDMEVTPFATTQIYE